jgi:hypothetical protein
MFNEPAGHVTAMLPLDIGVVVVGGLTTVEVVARGGAVVVGAIVGSGRVGCVVVGSGCVVVEDVVDGATGGLVVVGLGGNVVVGLGGKVVVGLGRNVVTGGNVVVVAVGGLHTGPPSWKGASGLKVPAMSMLQNVSILDGSTGGITTVRLAVTALIPGPSTETTSV